MSDRTQGSVRTGTRDDGTPAAANEARTEQPVSATQSIPTGTQRPVQAGTPAAQRPAGGAATGAGPAAGPLDAARAAAARNSTAKPPAKGAAAGAAKTRKGTARAGGRGPRRARLQLRHVDTWSAFKISLVLSIALFFIWMVAVGVLYMVLGGLGVFDTLNELFGQLSTAGGGEGGGEVITPGIVFGAAAVIGAINVVLLTALGTVATFIYNLSSDLVGGLEVTLSERD
jgi:Transmembrane domain of unknown function (DUF3566)